MRILVIASRVPASSRVPGSPRPYYFLRELAKSHDLHLLCLESPKPQCQEFAKLLRSEKICSEVEFLPVPEQPKWVDRQIHRLLRAPSELRRWRHPQYFSDIQSRVTKKIAAGSYDCVYVDGLSMTQYLPKAAAVPVVVDLCDSMWLLFSRMLEHEPNWLRRAGLRAERHALRSWECAVHATSDAVFVAADEDARALASCNAKRLPLVITNGVDLEYFVKRDELGKSCTIVFTGVMSYPPNSDAAIYFATEAFPKIRQQESSAEFHIVGKDPTPEVLALRDIPGVTVTGEVDDIRIFLSRASVFVAPLRVGAGIKNKILSAMALSRPVVATSLSLSGIPARDGAEVLIADTADQMATTIISLFHDESRAAAIAQAGYQMVHKEFSWEARGAAVRKYVEQVVAQRK